MDNILPSIRILEYSPRGPTNKCAVAGYVGVSRQFWGPGYITLYRVFHYKYLLHKLAGG